MDERALSAALAGLPLGGLRFYPSVGSTNDSALAWAAAEAADMSLVVADEQTAGRGRAGRRWQTPAGSALALSLIVRPSAAEADCAGRLAGLGALAVADCCRQVGAEAQIKWPNDVLLSGKKAAGILVETQWVGGGFQAAVIGIGVNVLAGSVPPPQELGFPATSLEAALGRPPDRLAVLRATLEALLRWRPQMPGPAFLAAWEQALAFRGTEVIILRDGKEALRGRLSGLEPDGSLRLLAEHGPVTVNAGEIQLRPGDDRIG